MKFRRNLFRSNAAPKRSRDAQEFQALHATCFGLTIRKAGAATG